MFPLEKPNMTSIQTDTETFLADITDPNLEIESEAISENTEKCCSSVQESSQNSLKIFKNVSYSLFCVNNFLFFSSLTVLWVYLNGYIIKKGLGNSSEAGSIYSVIGIGNIFGRVFLGVFCDQKRVDPIVIYTIGNFFLALNEFYASFAQNYRGKHRILFTVFPIILVEASKTYS